MLVMELSATTMDLDLLQLQLLGLSSVISLLLDPMGHLELQPIIILETVGEEQPNLYCAIQL
jgi:hypothetical protein